LIIQISNRCLKQHLLALFTLFFSATLLAQDPLAFASGSWFDPQRDGEGFVVQLIPGERAVVTWFTYPPEGEASEQAWLIGSGVTVGNRIEITEMIRPTGATFGPGFDPDSVVNEPWGTLEITFVDCNTAIASWMGPPDFGDGSLNLVRLSSIDDVECSSGASSAPDRVISGRSGIWFDPSHDGEGWMLETLADGRVVVYWFTYDDQGRQAWFIGVARIEGRTVWIEDMVITGGAHFGDAFRAADVVADHWGSFGFLFEDCDSGKMRYESTDPRFGEGTLDPVHLAQLAETDCTEPLAVEPLISGSWNLSTPSATAISESASAAAGGFVYTGGGFGGQSLFSRFDPVSGAHQDMPQLPGPRHHLMMTSDGKDIYLAGGYINKLGLGNPGNNFWRFDPVAGAWEILPNMPNVKAAGAAVYMHGRVWVVGGEGSGSATQVYNIKSGEWELFPGEPAGSDHLQAVIFENEIWWMGGRTDRTFNRVKIWNPVTRVWRDGPPMKHARSGFAARVVQGQIIVTGGEVNDTEPFQIAPRLEVFAPGAQGWEFGLAPPVTVHGTTGAVINGEFVLIGGSDIAGRTSQNRSTQVLTPAAPVNPVQLHSIIHELIY
jgi:hypothetical protein